MQRRGHLYSKCLVQASTIQFLQSCILPHINYINITPIYPLFVLDVAWQNEHSSMLHGSVLNCRGSGRVCVKSYQTFMGFLEPLETEICLIGNFTNSNPKTNYAKKLTEVILAIDKKCIATKWKSDAILTIKIWFCELNSCVTLEKITYRCRIYIWQPF